MKRKQNTLVGHDIQNEMLDVMINHVVRDIIADFRNVFFYN